LKSEFPVNIAIMLSLLIFNSLLCKTDGKTLNKNINLGTHFSGLTDELSGETRYSRKYNTQQEYVLLRCQKCKFEISTISSTTIGLHPKLKGQPGNEIRLKEKWMCLK